MGLQFAQRDRTREAIDTLRRLAIERAAAERGVLLLSRGNELRQEAEAVTSTRLRSRKGASAGRPRGVSTPGGLSASEDYSAFRLFCLRRRRRPLYVLLGRRYRSSDLRGLSSQGHCIAVNHSPHFAPTPELTIQTGVEAMTLAVFEFSGGIDADPLCRTTTEDLVWINITTNPSAEWVARQITKASG